MYKFPNNFYVNEKTGHRVTISKIKMVHVYDHDDPRDVLDFWDTEKGVAQWCMENLDEDHEYYEAIMEAYEDEDWELIIKLEGCRHCNYEYQDEWIIEEIKGEKNHA